jgi:hypothetical protein
MIEREGKVYVSHREILAAMTPQGGWTGDTLAAWGVAWPPKKHWRELLITGRPRDPGTEREAA